MLKLNIISKKLKKEIKLKNIYINLKSIMIYLVIFVLLYSGILIFSEYILSSYYKEISDRKVLISQEAENYYQKIEDLNQEIEYVKNIQNENIRWSNFLEIFANTIEQGIILSNIEINQEKKSFTLQGVAQKRQDLLNLKNNLEKINIFTEITIPIKSLTQKENIIFDINTNFKSYEF